MPQVPIRVAAATTLVLAALAVPSAQGATTCFGQEVDKKGTAGSDVIEGTSGADVIAGLGGADHIIGKGGNDKLCGVGGDDVLSGGAGNDKITGGDGDDSITGGDGGDGLSGNSGDDVLSGNAGEDDIVGQAGSDMLHGGPDPDHLDGGTDPGSEVGDLSADQLNGGSNGTGTYPYGNHCHNADRFPANCDYADLEVQVTFDRYEPGTDFAYFTVNLKNLTDFPSEVTAHDIHLRGLGTYVSGGPASCEATGESGFACTGFKLAVGDSINPITMRRTAGEFGTSAGARVSSADWEFNEDNNESWAEYPE